MDRSVGVDTGRATERAQLAHRDLCVWRPSGPLTWLGELTAYEDVHLKIDA